MVGCIVGAVVTICCCSGMFNFNSAICAWEEMINVMQAAPAVRASCECITLPLREISLSSPPHLAIRHPVLSVHRYGRIAISSARQPPDWQCDMYALALTISYTHLIITAFSQSFRPSLYFSFSIWAIAPLLCPPVPVRGLNRHHTLTSSATHTLSNRERSKRGITPIRLRFRGKVG